MLSLLTLRQLAFRSSKVKSIPLSSLLCKRPQHVSSSFEASEAPSRQTLERGRFPRQRTFADISFPRPSRRFEVTQPPMQVNIKDIYSEDDTAASVDTRAVDCKVNEGGSEQETALPRYLANSESMFAFHLKLSQQNDLQYSAEDWKDLELKAYAENPGLQKSWEALCMQLMYKFGYADLATSLLDYLSTGNSSPKISTLALYMALQAQYGGKDKEQVIQETFRKVLEISDVFDAISAKYLILGLSATSQWQQALDILEMAKLTAKPGSGYYSPIIVAALRDNDPEQAFQLLDELALKGYEPRDNVLVQVLQECETTGSHALLERYLSCVWNYNWLLSPAAAKEVELYFTGSAKEKWSCKWTTVNTVRGTCQGCKHSMDRIELASCDFEGLQREFLEKSLIGSNVYLKSNPQEVERFRDFVMENAPFDVVLDALNIALKGQRTDIRRSKQLRNVVHYFARERQMRVLVMGRAHMRNWPAPDMNYISRHAKIFFTEDISSDDPFCLHATLYSGKDCLFMSGDFMRDHKYTLGPRFKDIFERWQKSRQIINFEMNASGVSIKMPNQYNCGPVKSNAGWHIPYDDGTCGPQSTSQPVLCLRYKGQRASLRHVKKRNASD